MKTLVLPLFISLIKFKFDRKNCIFFVNMPKKLKGIRTNLPELSIIRPTPFDGFTGEEIVHYLECGTAASNPSPWGNCSHEIPYHGDPNARCDLTFNIRANEVHIDGNKKIEYFHSIVCRSIEEIYRKIFILIKVNHVNYHDNHSFVCEISCLQLCRICDELGISRFVPA